mgnify:CR=1 FL=1
MKKAIFYLLACVLLPVAASADEGMWLVSTFRDVIYPQMKKEGLKLKPGEIYNEESPALCNAIVAVDGGITAPEAVRTKLELGDGYGMRGASALGKEWYEHSAGYCSYLKGKTEAEAASIPADGSDPDLAALCTISIDALQKAVGDAFENGSL